MSGIFASKLNENFDAHDGSMTNYLQSDHSTALTPRYHYDLRAFHALNPTVPFTQNDYDFWHLYAYNSMNTYSVADNRPLGTAFGTETWSNGTVAKNSSYRYSNTMTLSVSAAGSTTYGVGHYGTDTYGVSNPITYSTFGDDILTDFNVAGHSYFLQVVLRSLPSQASSPKLDLTNSFIDISSSATFDPTVTDTLAFSASLNSVSGGGDCYLSYNRNSLTHADLTNIQGVRFRLLSVGGTVTFIMQAMRLVRDDYSFQVIDVDTKRGQLARSVPQAGGSESGSVYGDIYFKGSKPKDSTYVVSFNAGHNPTGNDNVYRQYFRTQANGDRIEVNIAARDTQSRLTIKQTVSGVTTTIYQSSINTNILTNESYYYLVIKVIGTVVNATVYANNGILLGSSVYTSGDQTTTLTSRGLVGYSFEPYNYDFTIQYIAPQTTAFATFQTTSFASHSLVIGATLYPQNSTPLNLISDLTPKAWADATVSTDANGDLVVTRANTLPQGGVKWTPLTFTGDSNQLIIHGYLWTSLVQGSYRAALLDQFDSVQWLLTIPNVLANQWNEFTLLVTPNLLPESSYLHIQQLGTYGGSFKLRDVSLGYKTIEWDISGDNGTTWQSFVNAVGAPYTGAMFATPSTAFKLRAIANTDQGWIGGYQLVPNYKF